MALRFDYVVRETGTNLIRNVTLTVASVVTIAVTLTLLGASLLLTSALGNATERWRGGIEFIVYMQPSISDEQRASIQEALEENPDIKQVKYVDRESTFEEFKRLFRDSPQVVKTVTPDILPTSYRVVPQINDPEVVGALGEQFAKRAGVREVVYAEKTIRALERIFGKVSTYVRILAGTLLMAAVLLILNTIRVAMFARRREIEVMKLVGATNWFIRVPFILEGIVQALFSWVVSVFFLFFVRRLIEGLAEEDFPLFNGFVVNSDEFVVAALVVGGIGLVIGALGSAFAASRFLDV